MKYLTSTSTSISTSKLALFKLTLNDLNHLNHFKKIQYIQHMLCAGMLLTTPLLCTFNAFDVQAAVLMTKVERDNSKRITSTDSIQALRTQMDAEQKLNEEKHAQNAQALLTLQQGLVKLTQEQEKIVREIALLRQDAVNQRAQYVREQANAVVPDKLNATTNATTNATINTAPAAEINTDLALDKKNTNNLNDSIDATHTTHKIDAIDAIDTHIVKDVKLTNDVSSDDVNVKIEALYQLGFKLLRQRNFKQAQTVFKKISMDYETPQAAQAQYYLGNVYHLLQANSKALLTLAQFIKAHPQNDKVPEAYLAIAKIQLDDGQVASGKNTLKYVLKNYANHEVALTAKKRLDQLNR